MNGDWIHPKTIIGPPAEGEYFYPRDQIVDEIWFQLNKGSHVLIAAPRRVGKTSVMKYMQQNQKNGFILIFENIESIKSEKEFYKRIYILLLNCLKVEEKNLSWIGAYLKSKKITEINLTGGIKIEHGDLNYKEELNELIPKIETKVVLMLDELPEVLHNLHLESKNEEASGILSTLRYWRQNTEFKNLKFILSGSVGLHQVVHLIEKRNTSINDLNEVYSFPLETDDAYKYIEWAIEDASIHMEKAEIDYLIDKVQYCVPFFFNLMLDEIDKLAFKQHIKVISINMIDEIFDFVIKTSKHFEDWKNRLSKYLPIEDFKFVNEILSHISHRGSISDQVIYDKAIKHGREDDYMHYIRDLEKDGYIVKQEEVYVFISPFLQEFWKRDNPNYND